MELIFWWMLILWIAAIIGYWLVRHFLLKQRKRKELATILPVAHTSHLTSLKEYAVVLRRYRILISWTTGLLSLNLLLAILLTARPATVSTIVPEQQSRDIMLCLDASGSVLKEDTILLDRFSTLVNSFSGQRFGLTLFNSSAVTVIPLNDNYQLITQQLKVAAKAFKAQKGAIFTQLTDGTLASFDSGTSLVTDGLTSCMEHMDTGAQHRSQSVVLATDNEINGTPVISVTQAVAIAKQGNIHIFTLDPGVSDPKLAGDHGQLQTIAKETGGNAYKLSDADAVDSIISNINSQQTQDFVGLPQPATNDSPELFLYGLAILTVASLALIWRLEL